MNKIFNPERKNWKDVLKRPTQTVSDIEGTVNEIFTEVQNSGDTVLEKYTKKFDGITLDTFRVLRNEIDEATALVNDDLKHAISQAKKNIETFHRAQETSKVEIETAKGVRCWHSKSRTLYSRRLRTIVLNHFNVGGTSQYCRVSGNCVMYSPK